jgi:hypothetical protein
MRTTGANLTGGDAASPPVAAIQHLAFSTSQIGGKRTFMRLISAPRNPKLGIGRDIGRAATIFATFLALNGCRHQKFEPALRGRQSFSAQPACIFSGDVLNNRIEDAAWHSC